MQISDIFYHHKKHGYDELHHLKVFSLFFYILLDLFYDCANFRVNRSISCRDFFFFFFWGGKQPPPPPPMDSSPQNNPIGLGLIAMHKMEENFKKPNFHFCFTKSTKKILETYLPRRVSLVQQGFKRSLLCDQTIQDIIIFSSVFGSLGGLLNLPDGSTYGYVPHSHLHGESIYPANLESNTLSLESSLIPKAC